MKKLLQFVALVLVLSVSAQPALTESACSQRACGNQRMMDCCSQAKSMAAAAMPMDMNCGENGPVATSPRLCADVTCCPVSATSVPAILAPDTSTTAIQIGSIPLAIWLTPATPVARKRPPRPGATLPTARYILFRDFRI